MLDELIEDLKRDEGWVPHAYDDSLGFTTIGYGFLIDRRRGGRLPKRVAEIWLEILAFEKWHELCREKPFLIGLPEHVQRAVGNMAYQLGVAGVLQFRNMLAALERYDFEDAARQALISRWADQTPRRAQRVAALIRGDTEETT